MALFPRIPAREHDKFVEDVRDAGTDVRSAVGIVTTTQAAAVDDDDVVMLSVSPHGEVYLASHDYTTQSDRVAEVDPIPEKYEYSTIAAVTNGTDGTYSYYIPMAGYTRLDLQLLIDGGSGTVTVTVEASIQADGTAPASLTYVDVTNSAYGSASFTASSFLADTAQYFGGSNYVKVQVVASTASANDGDWTIYSKKSWR